MSKRRKEENLSRRGFLGGVVAAGAGSAYAGSPSGGPAAAAVQAGQSAVGGASEEPNMETAFQWWTELPEKYTPIGWKDHMFRFNVLYDGTLIADPFSNQRTEQWRGQGLQLSVAPGLDCQAERSFYKRGDDNAVIQGWESEPTPVLWSEWTWEGLYLRQSIFAHMRGGNAVQTGTEPLYAWIRLSIHDICDALPVEDRYGFVLQLNAPFITQSMHIRNNLFYHPEHSKYPPDYTAVGYPRRLFTEPDEYSNDKGLSILEYSLWETKPRGRVRLVVLPSRDASVDFRIGHPTEDDSTLGIQMDVRRGNFVDVLVPMLPTERDEIEREIQLGYEGALE
jgi:hypothetical protein